ncbi:hypothetical protein C4566_02495 [Candidatus Parcubacteria bacterium]|nr:MAG: hypothetical protein C4566_02495 [Candidatus Parcubacteria bacterium]
MKELPKLPGQERRYTLPGQKPVQYDRKKSSWLLNYSLKGMAFGLAVSLGYFHFYTDYYSVKIIISSAVLGYFVGWAIGSFMYRDRSAD